MMRERERESQGESDSLRERDMLICVGMSPLLYVRMVLSGGLASVGDVSDPMAGCASP